MNIIIIINSLLAVDEPVVYKGKGRLMGSRNKRQRVFDNSTRRESSGFEHAEAAIIRARGGGRRRGRGRGDRHRDQASTTSSTESSSSTAPLTLPSEHNRDGQRDRNDVPGVPSSFTSTFTF